MSSNKLNLLLRISGLAITIILLIQPWLIKAEYADPFFMSGWAQIFASFISFSVVSLWLAFYRPLKGYNNLYAALLISFIGIGISLYHTHYTVCFRVSMLYIGLLGCICCCRLTRKKSDNYSIAGMIALSGFFMAIYAICQHFGYDFLIWNSKYQVVGTLTNPNFLSIFLCLTSSITFGLFAEFFQKNLKNSLIFLSFFITQIIVLLILNKTGSNLCLFFMLLIWVWSKWFKVPGKLYRKSPIVSGFIIAVIILLVSCIFFKEISNYSWEKITKPSNKYQPFISRILLWQIGFNIFKEHPYTGTGVGAIPYLMPLQRPPTASLLGLATTNDDPHSFVITTLAETGFLGLWGICSILTAIYGCFIRKKMKIEIDEDSSDNSNQIIFPWEYTLTTVFILYFSFKSGFVNQNILPFAIVAVIIFFGISTSVINDDYSVEQNDYFYISKGTLTAILTFSFYSLFNNSFSILPLTSFLVAIISLHFSCCLPDVKYKPKITIISLLFIFLPVIYGFLASQFQLNYQREQTFLYNGTNAYNNREWKKSAENFLSAINTNPQCLRAYHGRALALVALGQHEEAQELLTELDNMVPNIYNVKLEIAKILLENCKILEAHRYAVKNLDFNENPSSYELFGQILLSEGRHDEAIKVFKEGLVGIPSSNKERLSADRIHLSLAALAFNKEDYQECKNHLFAIKSNIENELDALYMKGTILSQEKKYEEALEVYEKCLLIYPNVPRVLNATGYLLIITNKDLDRAQNLLERAYEIIKSSEPRDLADLLMICNSLGKLYQKQNKLNQASELLKYSYEETPNEWTKLKANRLKDLNDFYNSFSSAEQKQK